MTAGIEGVTAELHDWVHVTGRIWGRIYNDTEGRFPDGKLIHTSNAVISGDIATTTNAIYHLIGEGKIV